MLGSLRSNGYVAGDDDPPHARFKELARAAGLSRSFTLSVKLQLYTLLRRQREEHGAADGLQAADIAQHLGLKADPGFRGVVDWLDLLASLELLQRSGEGAAARYSNTPAAERYLTRQSHQYMGGHAVVYHDRTYPQLVFLEHSLRTGEQSEVAQQLVAPVVDMFAGQATGAGSAGAGGDPTEFALGMTGCNQAAFEALAARFDFKPFKTLTDVGGSAGALCCAVAAAHPHIAATTCDLPSLHAAAEQYVTQRGLAGRVTVADLNMFDEATPIPSAELITMSMVLHDWGPARKMLLMRKAFAALPPGGAFIALDTIIDDERARNVWGLLMSLDMAVEFGSERAADYTFKEFTGWAADAGFARTELVRLAGPNSAAVAYKAA